MAVKGRLQSINEVAGQSRDKRHALHLETSGALATSGEVNVTVHNISSGGMLLETSLALENGDQVEVDLPEAGLVRAQVVWASGMLFGCQFEQPLSVGSLSATQLRANSPLPPEIGRPLPSRMPEGGLFGKQLEKLRKQRGLTLAQVADALGVSKPTVWAWEKGKARPIEDRLPAIAAALHIDEADLTRLSEPPGLAELLKTSRARIAEAYGTTPDHVRIMIEV